MRRSITQAEPYQMARDSSDKTLEQRVASYMRHHRDQNQSGLSGKASPSDIDVPITGKKASETPKKEQGNQEITPGVLRLSSSKKLKIMTGS